MSNKKNLVPILMSASLRVLFATSKVSGFVKRRKKIGNTELSK
jgi:hypothetical protein